MQAFQVRNICFVLITILCVAGFSVEAYAQNGPQTAIVHVNIDCEWPSSDPEDGESWATAFRFLQDALDAADTLMNPPFDFESVDIWVAAGTYRPDQRADICGTQDEDCLPCGDCAVGATFAIPSNVRIFGGFNGSENHPGERDHNPSVTILSGNLAGDGSQRSHDIVTFDDTDESARLDTVTVEGAGERGVRMFNSDAIVSNCIIRHNTRGALMEVTTTGEEITSFPRFINCQFIENDHLGGMRVERGVSATVVNSLLLRNFSKGNGGAIGVYGDAKGDTGDLFRRFQIKNSG